MTIFDKKCCFLLVARVADEEYGVGYGTGSGVEPRSILNLGLRALLPP